jgi:hypothetical protein
MFGGRQGQISVDASPCQRLSNVTNNQLTNMSIQTNKKKEQTKSNGNPEPIVGNRGASILGPRNVPIERQNPDALIAPATDAGTVPNFKWPFALSHNRVLSGGFSENETFLICDWFAHTPREVLAKNFGVDKSAFDALPTDIGHTRYMFAGKVPPSLSEDAPPPPRQAVAAVLHVAYDGAGADQGARRLGTHH